VISNYNKDESLREIVEMSESARQMLEDSKAFDVEYDQIGSWRPDLLHCADGARRICEINARFPFNGYILSDALCSSQLQEEVCEGRLWRPTGERACENAIVSGMLNRAGSTCSGVFLAKESEKGWDIHVVKRLLAKRGVHVKCGGIAELRESLQKEEDSSLCYALELSAAELTLLAPAELHTLHRRACLNDLRTIVLGHDKRMLALLSTEGNRLRSYLSDADLAVLKKRIIPTFVIGKHPAEVEAAKREKDKFVVKANAMGKGKGVYVGKWTSQAEWEAVLSSPSHSKYVLQPFMEQAEVEISSSLVSDEHKAMNSVWCGQGAESDSVFAHAVGTLLCFDDAFLGYGIVRATPSSFAGIGNISNSAAVGMAPLVLTSDLLAQTPRWREEWLIGFSASIRTSPLPLPSPTVTSGHPRSEPLEDTTASKQISPRSSPPSRSDGFLPNFSPPSSLVISAEADVDTSSSSWKKRARNALFNEGLAVVDLNLSYSDDDDLNSQLAALLSDFGELNMHGGEELNRAIWDVKPKAKAERGREDAAGQQEDVLCHASHVGLEYGGVRTREEVKASAALPRSHTGGEFPLHTDCCFEKRPPRFLSLYVKEEDKKGGGLSRVVDGRALLLMLNDEEKHMLSHTKVGLRVPAEFDKGKSIEEGAVLAQNGSFWRLRQEVVVASPSSPTLPTIEKICNVGNSVSASLNFQLKKGQLLLLDNARFFHARTSILDEKRWLKRARFHPLQSDIECNRVEEAQFV